MHSRMERVHPAVRPMRDEVLGDALSPAPSSPPWRGAFLQETADPLGDDLVGVDSLPAPGDTGGGTNCGCDHVLFLQSPREFQLLGARFVGRAPCSSSDCRVSTSDKVNGDRRSALPQVTFTNVSQILNRATVELIPCTCSCVQTCSPALRSVKACTARATTLSCARLNIVPPA